MSVFGSLAAGSPVLLGPGSPAAIMNSGAYLGGWFNAIIQGGAPTIEDMNGLFYVDSYQLNYILQQGIPEWNSQTTYYTNNFVANNGLLYVSLLDNNLNHTVSTGTAWQLFAAGGSSSGVSSLNALTGNIAITQGSNASVNTTGSSIVISGLFNGNNYLALNGSNSPASAISFGGQDLTNLGSVNATKTVVAGVYPLSFMSGSGYILLDGGTTGTPEIQIYGGFNNILAMQWDDNDLILLNKGAGLDLARIGLNHFDFFDGSNNITFSKDTDQNIIVGLGALSTTGTSGFLYIPTMPGMPTGTPKALTGRAPMIIDSTDNSFYFYSSGSWHTPSGGGGGGVSSLNGLTGPLALIAGSNVTFGSTGSTITINSSGGGGGGANTTLSNLGTTAINADLLFDADQTYDIGASAAVANDIYTLTLKTAGVDQTQVQVSGCILIEETGHMSVSWTDRQLLDPTENVSVDWNGREFFDELGNLVGGWGSSAGSAQFAATNLALIQTTDTSATAGAASTLPITPELYIEININGTVYKIPAYNV